jgi:major membrane immunogen (membrane-anchored lipoprotein)
MTVSAVTGCTANTVSFQSWRNIVRAALESAKPQ